MLIRDPCKKCIVRACCTKACGDKIDQVNNIECVFYSYYVVKHKVIDAFSWVMDNCIDIAYCLIILGGVIIWVWSLNQA